MIAVHPAGIVRRPCPRFGHGRRNQYRSSPTAIPATRRFLQRVEPHLPRGFPEEPEDAARRPGAADCLHTAALRRADCLGGLSAGGGRRRRAVPAFTAECCGRCRDDLADGQTQPHDPVEKPSLRRTAFPRHLDHDRDRPVLDRQALFLKGNHLEGHAIRFPLRRSGVGLRAAWRVACLRGCLKTSCSDSQPRRGVRLGAHGVSRGEQMHTQSTSPVGATEA